jgi:hypothetical protein
MDCEMHCKSIEAILNLVYPFIQPSNPRVSSLNPKKSDVKQGGRKEKRIKPKPAF